MIRILLLVAGAIVVGMMLRKFLDKGETVTLEARTVPQSDEGVKELLGRGKKIAAIKLYRQIHNVGLKEAKEAVERLQRQG